MHGLQKYHRNQHHVYMCCIVVYDNVYNYLLIST